MFDRDRTSENEPDLVGLSGPIQRERGSAAGPVQAKAQLQGLSLPEQLRAVAPQTPGRGAVQLAAEEGSAQVVASAGSEERAYEDKKRTHFTPQLVKMMGEGVSLQAALDTMMDQVFQPKSWLKQHHTGVVIGSRPSAGGKEASEHIGVVVGNEHYVSMGNLPGATQDATAMKGALEGQGYKVDQQADLTAIGIDGAFEGALGKGGEGDRVALYYAGHGDDKGLAGVGFYGSAADGAAGEAAAGSETSRGLSISKNVTSGSDVYPHADLSALVGKATSSGINLTVVLDACMSGSATDKVRQDYASELAEKAEGTDVEPLLEASRRLEGLKGHLSAIQSMWSQTLSGLRKDMDLTLRLYEAGGGPTPKPEERRRKAAQMRIDAKEWFKSKMDKFWKDRAYPVVQKLGGLIRQLGGVEPKMPPETISDHKNLGALFDALDDLAQQALTCAEKQLSTKT